MSNNWNPREEVGPWGYLRLKLGLWVEVQNFPDWIGRNPPTSVQGRELSRDTDRVYYERELWEGESLRYMMKWEPYAQKELKLVGQYVKVK